MTKTKGAAAALVLLAGFAPLSVALANGSAAAVHDHKGKGTIVDAAMKSSMHETLVAAVKAAGLAETLSGSGPFTVFAPTDAAFGKLPDGTVQTLLQPANRDQLRAVLTYHVVPGRVSAGDLVEQIRAGNGHARLTTVQGGTLTARLQGGNVVLTDAAGGTATVVKADMMQSNGIIHVTDAVSLPG